MKIFTNWILENIKKITYYDQIILILEIQGWFNIWKYVNVVYHINNSKNTYTHTHTHTLTHSSHLIIGWKAFNKISIIKVLERPEIQRTCLHSIKAIYSKYIANVSLNGEKLKSILLKPGAIWDRLPFQYIFNKVLEVLHRAIKQLKEIKGVQIGNEVLLFVDNMMVNISYAKNSTQKRLQMIKPLAKWLDSRLT
jgi:DNA-binding ferritin-like protein (Dps family)